MQYIWEVVLAAEKNGIREADLRYEVQRCEAHIWRFHFVT